MPNVATEPADRLRTEQTIHVRQVLHGRATCEYCNRRATWLIASGADPDLLPHCSDHAAEVLRACASVIGSQIRG